MPISSFGSGLQKAIAFLPGTYGTSLVRNHSMRGVLSEMEKQGVPSEVAESFKDAVDCNVYFFDKQVDIPIMFAILFVSIAILIGAYVLLNVLKKPAKSS